MKTKLALFLVGTVALSALVAACSGAIANVDADAGAGDGGTGQGSDGATSGGDSATSGGDATTNSGADAGTLSPLCPSGIPMQGSPCTTQGLECEYGADVDISCDTLATCTQSAWNVAGPSAFTCGVSPDASTCPGSIAQAQAMSAQCMPTGQTCAYPDGVCACTSDHTGAPIVWTCFPTAGCSYPRPRIGSVCTMDGQQCDYSTCGDSIACKGGLWIQSNGGCHP